MLRLEAYEKIIKDLGWLPAVDYACDPLGSNALAVGFYDVFSNSLKQKKYMRGKDGVINPPFCSAKPFIKLAEEAFAEDSDTRILLIVPERKG
jgi:hypothetical protein